MERIRSRLPWPGRQNISVSKQPQRFFPGPNEYIENVFFPRIFAAVVVVVVVVFIICTSYYTVSDFQYFRFCVASRKTGVGYCFPACRLPCTISVKGVLRSSYGMATPLKIAHTQYARFMGVWCVCTKNICTQGRWISTVEISWSWGLPDLASLRSVVFTPKLLVHPLLFRL